MGKAVARFEPEKERSYFEDSNLSNQRRPGGKRPFRDDHAQRAVDLDPEDEESHIFLGQLYRIQRQTAEADYWVERLQLARIQPLSFREPDPEQQAKQWILFGKLDGQLASGALVPAEAKAVGGLDNVRGYKEREVLGDNGISGTLEVRSPIWVGSLLSLIPKK